MNHLLNCASPLICATIAEPRPCVATTLSPPIMLQTVRYTSIVFLPYRGPAQNIVNKQPRMTTPA